MYKRQLLTAESSTEPSPPGRGRRRFDPGRFEAFLFDAGGVLVIPDPTVLGPTLAPYGADTTFAATLREASSIISSPNMTAPLRSPVVVASS